MYSPSLSSHGKAHFSTGKSKIFARDVGSVIASYKKSPYYIKDTFYVSVHGFAKSFIFFFFKPLHINKDTRFQNIDVCEDIFAVKKVIVCLCKKVLS